MLRTFAAAIAGAMTSLALIGSTTYAQPERASRVITVQIQGQIAVDPRTLFAARADVSRLFRQAGMELLWVTSHPDIVIILSGDREACAMGAGQHTMGQAVTNRASRMGRVAYVFSDRVQDLASAAGLEPAGVLGPVMAHEMAHLLGVSHAERGLMRDRWSDLELALASQGLLQFSPAQSEVLRQSFAALNTPYGGPRHH